MSRQYINASKALTEVLSGKSLKNYCNRNKVGKTEYALICETIKYIDVIEKLFEVCQISAESLDVNKGLLLVYCYELLFGNGKIQGGGVVKRRLLEIEHEIRDALLQMMHQRGVDSHESLIDSHFVEHDKMPVYIRINTLKIDEAQGRRLLFETYPGAARDQHIPNLISLPAGTKRAWDHELVKGGALIVQVDEDVQ